MATERAQQSIPTTALADDFFRQRIVNFMLGGCQFILGYAKFVTHLPPTIALAGKIIMPRMRLRLLVS